jgi:uncharacterized membrane protein
MAKSKLFTPMQTKKAADLKKELIRAHVIIALLAFLTIVLLIELSSLLPELNGPLVIVSIVLLSLLCVTSVSIALVLRDRKK